MVNIKLSNMHMYQVTERNYFQDMVEGEKNDCDGVKDTLSLPVHPMRWTST